MHVSLAGLCFCFIYGICKVFIVLFKEYIPQFHSFRFAFSVCSEGILKIAIKVFLQQLDSPAVVVFFLRTLMAIDSEVVDREIQRTKEVITVILFCFFIVLAGPMASSLFFCFFVANPQDFMCIKYFLNSCCVTNEYLGFIV